MPGASALQKRTAACRPDAKLYAPDLSYGLTGADPLSSYRASLSSARLSAGKTRLTFVGTSETAGVGAGAPIPDQVAAMLGANTGAGQSGLVYLNDHAGVHVGSSLAYSLTFSGGWAYNQNGYFVPAKGVADNTLGCASLGTGSATLGSFYCAGFIVYYFQRTTTGSFTVAIDAGAPVTVGGASGSDQLSSYTVMAGSTGSHSITFAGAGATTAGNVIIVAVEPILGTGSGQGLYVSNMGVSGSYTLDWFANSHPWNAYALAWSTPQPNLTIIEAMIQNDYQAGQTPSSVATNLQTIIGWAQQYGSVLVWTPLMRTDVTGTYPWSQYLAAVQTACTAKNVPYLNVAQWLGCSAMSDLGGVYDAGDHVHFNAYGKYQVARLFTKALTSI